ncbi:hypothetical protein SDC9_155596 [bioreactor metagenome]|uniref:Uncharacterized protein n=1 Tax=bioreactor metagenome TaxID=1076179 RepID=A0A645F6S4_9ZZZZ
MKSFIKTVAALVIALMLLCLAACAPRVSRDQATEVETTLLGLVYEYNALKTTFDANGLEANYPDIYKNFADIGAGLTNATKALEGKYELLSIQDAQDLLAQFGQTKQVVTSYQNYTRLK